MIITRHRTPVKPKPKGNAPPRLFRSFFLWVGVSALIVFAVLVAVSWDPGLADFLFWLIAIWMVFVRYVEIEHAGKETQHIQPKTLREWRRYSIKLLLAAGFLYLLAKILTHQDLI